jgi:hypothetical protein
VTGNPDNLRRAAAAKRRAAHERADKGLRQLVKRGDAITFASVAAAAGVSKDFLYRTADLRGRIEQLRSQQTPRQPGRASSIVNDGDVSSVVRTLTLKLTQERAQHRREIAELHAALATAHGELRLLKRRHGIAEP